MKPVPPSTVTWRQLTAPDPPDPQDCPPSCYHQHPPVTVLLLNVSPPFPWLFFLPIPRIQRCFHLRNIRPPNKTYCLCQHLGDVHIHVDIPSCHLAAVFFQLLDPLNLQQHVDVPTHSRGHTLDLIISNSAPISNLQAYDLGVSDHKVVSIELPFPSLHTKPK